MDDYIAISTLNDFIFCPYSIYLHNVYMETDEGVYHATPQTRGRIAHETVDEKRTSNRSQGAIRLQFSVYEVNNTQRVINNIKIKIEETYSKLFTGADSVMIFNASKESVEKFGNAIHRDADIVYL